MSGKRSEAPTILESPGTITKRIETDIIRGAFEEERRAEKALSLLKARDRRIGFLERKIMELESHACNDSCARRSSWKISPENSCIGSSSKETNYVSLSTDTMDFVKLYDREIGEKNRKIREKHEKLVQEGDSTFEKSNISNASIKHSEISSIPFLKSSLSNFKSDAVIFKNVNLNFNESSNVSSDEFRQDDSSVNLVVTAALAFSKFDDVQRQTDDRAKISLEERNFNNHEGKKHVTARSSRTNFPSMKMATSLPGIKTRRAKKQRKRRTKSKIERTLNQNSPIENLHEVHHSNLNESSRKTTNLIRNDDKPRLNMCSTASCVQKRKVEDKVAREDAQEAASISNPFDIVEKNTTLEQTFDNFNEEFNESNNNIFERKDSTEFCSLGDEPAPQWLIEGALSRGEKNVDSQSTLDNVNSDSVEGKICLSSDVDNIITDLEKQLSTTRAELAEALNEQLNIKNKYKKALRIVKISADEERDKLQRKLVEICSSIIEKFGRNAFNNRTIKPRYKKRQRHAQHFGKLSKKIYKKLKIATLTSSRLEQQVTSVEKKLEEKSHDYESMLKCFSSLKIELQNTESNMNDLLNENISLRKKIEDTREWMQTKVIKERHDKINAAQFREIQRSRELTNLKKKSEEDLSTIAQLRGKLLRLESANANKGFLLNNYKSQLADSTGEKEILTSKLKELETDNNSLRNANAQLKANLTLINREKEKVTMGWEKSELEVKNRMQSKLAAKDERSVLQTLNTMRAENDKTIEAMQIKLKASEHTTAEYRKAIKRFLKEISDYNRELDAENNWSCSESSEREAHETACEILNITPGELTGFLKGRSTDTINLWLSNVEKITSKKSFAEDLGQFLFDKAISTKEIDH